jgi:hypothetical protein
MDQNSQNPTFHGSFVDPFGNSGQSTVFFPSRRVLSPFLPGSNPQFNRKTAAAAHSNVEKRVDKSGKEQRSYGVVWQNPLHGT